MMRPYTPPSRFDIMTTGRIECTDEGELITDDECEDEESDDDDQSSGIYVTPSTSPRPGTSIVSIYFYYILFYSRLVITPSYMLNTYIRIYSLYSVLITVNEYQTIIFIIFYIYYM
jgi:hypothetical protein